MVRITLLGAMVLVALAACDDAESDGGDAECTVEARCPDDGRYCDTDGPDAETCAEEAAAAGLEEVCGEMNGAIWCPAD